MNVKQLKEVLSNMDDNTIVRVLSVNAFDEANYTELESYFAYTDNDTNLNYIDLE